MNSNVNCNVCLLLIDSNVLTELWFRISKEGQGSDIVIQFSSMQN